MENEKAPLSIRAVLSSADWDFVGEACCLTGNGGDPISSERFHFFQKVWVEPYRRCASNEAILLLGGSERLGYLTGCSDTVGFERRKKSGETRLFSEILVKVHSHASLSSDERRFYLRYLQKEVSPTKAFGKKFLRELYLKFPAHLHMNLLETARGSGGGTLLFEAYLKELRRRKVSGLHVFCGEKPKPFYEKQGMQLLRRLEFRPGVYVYALGIEIVSH